MSKLGLVKIIKNEEFPNELNGVESKFNVNSHLLFSLEKGFQAVFLNNNIRIVGKPRYDSERNFLEFSLSSLDTIYKTDNIFEGIEKTVKSFEEFPGYESIKLDACLKTNMNADFTKTFIVSISYKH